MLCREPKYLRLSGLLITLRLYVTRNRKVEKRRMTEWHANKNRAANGMQIKL